MSAETIAKTSFDVVPLGLVVLLVLLAWPVVGSTSTWLTLTVAGLAMGMIIFIVASGLTLVFGLMDVLNFGHGVFIAIGAYLAVSVFAGLTDWSTAADVAKNLVVVAAAMLAGAAVAGVVGIAFERLLIRPVYGQHLKQILVTMGGLIIGEELIKVIWGPAQIPLPPPEALRGSILFAGATVEKLRLVAVVVGAVVLVALLFT
ncbi:MAG: branched-chain amino acid ABC transporter permease, partial [Pseudomonadota bacterium]|nr:branched-chain amino acid ABC transporter permease [Pseudomonadota bacterium]